MKYLFIKLNERNGEQEYKQDFLIAVENDADINETAEQVASTWYDDETADTETVDNEYFFLGGTIAVHVISVQEISKEHYDILQQYI